MRGLFAAVAVVAALVLPTGAGAQPAPQILEISVPSTVQAGQEFTLTVRATNRGEVAARGSISVSFPDQDLVAVVDSSRLTSPGSYAKVYATGQPVFNLEQNKSVPAAYPLAEMFLEEQWPPGAERFMTLRVTAPVNRATVRMQARVTLRTSAGFFTSPSSGPIDQQGFPVQTGAVPVRVPVPPSPAPTSAPTVRPTVPPPPTTGVIPPIAPPLPATATARSTAEPRATPRLPAVAPSQPADSTASAILTVLGTLLVAGVLAGLAIALTRHPRRRTPAFSRHGPELRSQPPSSADSYAPARSVSYPGASNGVSTVPAGYQIAGAPKHGGMAVVYKAFQPALNRYVALKVLSPALGADPSFVQRFHTEAQHTASLEHPNIVPIYDLGEAGGSVFIAMRYIDGLSLQELLVRERQLPITRAIRIGAQIAEALDYAHGRGIIHRDVKPANVMIEQGDRATLTDFGIARVAGSSRLTTTGSIVGTPDYLSPEQARGSDVDARTDLYSLAIVTYEMLAGRPPFQSDNPLSVVHAQIATMPPPVTQFNSSVPPEVAAVLLRAMAKEPSQRFASCREFISAIRQAATAAV
jgi:hypothetical protein